MSSRFADRLARAASGALAFGAGVLASAPLLAADCAGGVRARNGDVDLCVQSHHDQRQVTLTALRATQLSAEAGVEVLSCEAPDATCRSVAVHTGPGETFPRVTRFGFDAAMGGRYRLEYGVCDKVQQVCIPGEITIRLP